MYILNANLTMRREWEKSQKEEKDFSLYDSSAGSKKKWVNLNIPNELFYEYTVAHRY